jgi:hypothetical protein
MLRWCHYLFAFLGTIIDFDETVLEAILLCFVCILCKAIYGRLYLIRVYKFIVIALECRDFVR